MARTPKSRLIAAKALLYGAGGNSLILNVWHAIEQLTDSHPGPIKFFAAVGFAVLGVLAGVIPVYLAAFMPELAAGPTDGPIAKLATYVVVASAMLLSLKAQAEMVEKIFGELDIFEFFTLNLAWLFPLSGDIATFRALTVILHARDAESGKTAHADSTDESPSKGVRQDAVRGDVPPTTLLPAPHSVSPHPPHPMMPSGEGSPLTGEGSPLPSGEAPVTPPTPSPVSPPAPSPSGAVPTAPTPAADTQTPSKPAARPNTDSPSGNASRPAKKRNARKNSPVKAVDVKNLSDADLVALIDGDLASGVLESLSGRRLVLKYGIGSGTASDAVKRYQALTADRDAKTSEGHTGTNG